jgi:hypothetical protein
MKVKWAYALVLAALAAIGVVVPSASAKVCSAAGAGEACGGTHGSVYSGTMEGSLKSGTSATLTATNAEGKSVSTVTCVSSSVRGSVTGSTAIGSITSVAFANCSSSVCPNGITASTTASLSNPWPASATTGTAPNGTLTVEKLEGEFVCSTIIGSVTCRYSASSASGTVTGGSPATVGLPVGLAKISGPEAVCGSKADWTGTYTVTTPGSVYLT